MSPNHKPITISADRQNQITTTITKYISNWHLTLDSDSKTAEFLSSYSPTIAWYDHAFLIQRVGHTAVLGLHKAFMHCNQPFTAEVKAIHPTPTGAVVEQIWRGKCANDIVRPNGEVAVKASGKDFVCHVCMVIEIGQDGLIVRIDEYYNWRWDDGIAEGEYAVLRGASKGQEGGLLERETRLVGAGSRPELLKDLVSVKSNLEDSLGLRWKIFGSLSNSQR